MVCIVLVGGVMTDISLSFAVEHSPGSHVSHEKNAGKIIRNRKEV